METRKNVSSAAYRSGRIAVLQDLGDSIPEVPVDWLLANALPQITYDLDATKRRLVTGRHITKRGRWYGFPKDPKESATNEAQTFWHLESAIKNIIECAEVQGSKTVTYFDNPNRAPHSHRSNSTRPDGYFVRETDPTLPPIASKSTSQAHPHRWDDISLSAEYKKGASDDDKDDNTEKILWSIHHVMRSDPCRRFTYGITVENTQTRIWFASRSRVFVTESFNFIENHEMLIRFVVPFSYASTVDLGWDPTIQRVSINGSVQYDITIHDVSEEGETVERLFRTTKVLADFSADALRGRGTRVFEVRQMVGNTPSDEHYALKDVWTDIDRDREGVIFKKLKTDAGPDWVELEKHLVTILHHGDVIINSEADNTLDLILHGQDVPTGSRFKLKLKEPVTNVRESGIGAPPTDMLLVLTPHTNALYQHKVHYRLVYKEVAEPVHSLSKLAEFFQALSDATTGLKIMHKHGWVHRDISSGNILMYRGSGKLSDLEYAKRMDTLGSHEIRTGTIDFMSIEIERQNYMFWTAPRSKDKKPTPPPFHYNPLHDLESLWWVCVWMMLCHRPHPAEQGDDDEKAAARKQRHDYVSTFPGVIHTGQRSDALMIDPILWRRLDPLPSTYRLVALHLEEIRWLLVTHFKAAENGPEIIKTAFEDIHGSIVDELRSAKSQSGDIRVRSLPRHPETATAG